MYNNAETEKKNKNSIFNTFELFIYYAQLYKINSRTRYLVLKYFDNLCKKKYYFRQNVKFDIRVYKIVLLPF